jgi:hypothetical protein
MKLIVFQFRFVGWTALGQLFTCSIFFLQLLRNTLTQPKEKKENNRNKMVRLRSLFWVLINNNNNNNLKSWIFFFSITDRVKFSILEWVYSPVVSSFKWSALTFVNDWAFLFRLQFRSTELVISQLFVCERKKRVSFNFVIDGDVDTWWQVLHQHVKRPDVPEGTLLSYPNEYNILFFDLISFPFFFIFKFLFFW